jgi:hypothetical protein
MHFSWQEYWYCIQRSVNQKVYNMNDILYNKLNKKRLDILRHIKCKQTKQHEEYKTGTTTTFYTRIKSMSNITFNREEVK